MTERIHPFGIVEPDAAARLRENGEATVYSPEARDPGDIPVWTAHQIREMVERVREQVREREEARRLDRLESQVASEALDALLAQVEEMDG